MNLFQNLIVNKLPFNKCMTGVEMQYILKSETYPLSEPNETSKSLVCHNFLNQLVIMFAAFYFYCTVFRVDVNIHVNIVY